MTSFSPESLWTADQALARVALCAKHKQGKVSAEQLQGLVLEIANETELTILYPMLIDIAGTALKMMYEIDTKRDVYAT